MSGPWRISVEDLDLEAIPPGRGGFFEYRPQQKIQKRKDPFHNMIEPILKTEKSDASNQSNQEIQGDVIKSIDILEKSCFSNCENIHENEHENDDRYRYFCETCKKGYWDEQSYARHLYAHTFVQIDEERITLMCPGCGKEFKGKTKIKYHQKHSSMPLCLHVIPRIIFSCKICKKDFTRKDNLREHLRSHTGKKKIKKMYDCNNCSKSFGGMSLLTLHQKVHATCTKTYNRKNKPAEQLVTIKREPIEDPIVQVKLEVPDSHEFKVELDDNLIIKEETMSSSVYD